MDMRQLIDVLNEAARNRAKAVIDAYNKNPVPGVVMELIPLNDETIGLQWINRKEGVPKGAGAEALDRLCELADEQEVWISLSVSEKDADGLIPFYSRYGFEEEQFESDEDYRSLNRSPDP